MKTIDSGFMNKTITSALLMLAAIAPLTVSTNAKSATLSVGSIIHETVNFTDPACGYSPGGPIAPGGTITGTGISSLLGSVSISAHDCITPLLNGSFSFSGMMTLTTSSGEIFADYLGLFVPSNYPSISLFTNSTFDITGGTGSFAKADGSGIFIGGENTTTGNGLLQLSGTITNFKKISTPFQFSTLTTSNVGSSSYDAAAIASLDPTSLSGGTTLGQYSLIDQNAQVLAETPVPEPMSLALLGIGLASLALARRRKPFNWPF